MTSPDPLAPAALTPIGVFHGHAKYPYDVPRQGVLAEDNLGWLELFPGHHFDMALEGLKGFSRLWILFLFHQNTGHWHPKVQPPRHTRQKVGVFATRSPYRPNPLGLSCVELLDIHDHTLLVRGHDLLDGTPILDIKPYLPYADAFPQASAGWTREQTLPEYQVAFSPALEEKLRWLADHGLACLPQFLREQLGEAPDDPKRHRLQRTPQGAWALAYRTWRIPFHLQEDKQQVLALDLLSAYSPKELLPNTPDPYGDKDLHRAFLLQFPPAGKEILGAR